MQLHHPPPPTPMILLSFYMKIITPTYFTWPTIHLKYSKSHISVNFLICYINPNICISNGTFWLHTHKHHCYCCGVHGENYESSRRVSPVTQMDKRANSCDEYPTSNDEEHGCLHPQQAFCEKWILILDLQNKTSLIYGMTLQNRVYQSNLAFHVPNECH